MELGITSEPTQIGALDFLADPPQKHIALLYENERRAKLLQFWYIIHGLTKGEHCIYVTYGDVDEERARMKAAGLDTVYYEKERGLLHIRRIAPIKTKEEIPHAINQLTHRAFEGAKEPFRIVLRLVHGEFDTDEKVKLVSAIEKGLHDGCSSIAEKGGPFAIFSAYRGSIVCHHPVKAESLEIIANLVATHDATVLVPQSGNLQFVKALPTVSNDVNLWNNGTLLER